jgi:hypothetical protein
LFYPKSGGVIALVGYYLGIVIALSGVLDKLADTWQQQVLI